MSVASALPTEPGDFRWDRRKCNPKKGVRKVVSLRGLSVWGKIRKLLCGASTVDYNSVSGPSRLQSEGDRDWFGGWLLGGVVERSPLHFS